MTRALLNSPTYSFLLPLAMAACLLCGCGSTDTSVNSTEAAALQAITLAGPRTSYTAFGDSITCGFVAAGATTAPPYSIGDGSCHTSNAYPSYLSAALGLPTQDYGIPGDQACDIWPRQIAPESVSPTSASAPMYSVLIGTNDAHVKGAGAYEANFRSCQMAVLAWLALPAESKSPVSSAVISGWTLGSAPSIGAYALATTPGATISFTVTTYGGPLYLWHTVNDRDAGVASVAVDGATAGGFATTPAVPVATQNGTFNTMMVERMTGIAAGTHTVVVTDLSGDIAISGLGTPPKHPSANHPIVLAGSVPAPEQGVGDYLLAPDAAYTADTAAMVAKLSIDGLDVRFASSASYLTGSPDEMTDIVHVTPLGALHLAAAFQAVAPNSHSGSVLAFALPSKRRGFRPAVKTATESGL